jgi:hypothetical protein
MAGVPAHRELLYHEKEEAAFPLTGSSREPPRRREGGA